MGLGQPDGAAAPSLFAPWVGPAPILWLAPSADPATAGFTRMVQPRLPATTPLTRIDVTSDHMGAPQAGADRMVEWLKELPD